MLFYIFYNPQLVIANLKHHEFKIVKTSKDNKKGIAFFKSTVIKYKSYYKFLFFNVQESTTTAAILGVLANMVDQAFLPVEKVCWLHDVGILKLSDDTAYKMETVSTGLWAASLYISLLQ